VKKWYNYVCKLVLKDVDLLEEYKRIASEKLLSIVGEAWIQKNIDNICSLYYDKGNTIIFIFCQTSCLPSEDFLVNNTDIEFQPQESISFEIDKDSKNCIVIKNFISL